MLMFLASQNAKLSVQHIALSIANQNKDIYGASDDF